VTKYEIKSKIIEMVAANPFWRCDLAVKVKGHGKYKDC
jgi:hypothetical protein